MSETPETSQSATGPYVAMADARLALTAWTAASRDALLVKVPGGDGGGEGGDSGGLGDGEIVETIEMPLGNELNLQVQAREFGFEEGVLPDGLDGRAQLQRARELALALQEVVWDDLQVRVDELPDNLPVGALLHAVFGEDALLHICPAQQVVCAEAAPLGAGLQQHLENGQRGGLAAPGCQVALCGYPALPEDDGRQIHTAYMVQTTRCLTLSPWAWWPCDGCAAPTTNGRRLPGAGVPTAAAQHPAYSYSYFYSYS
eukprot:scaffold700_cov50-Phaeocystis_antarctica.AAC.3